MYCIAAGFDDDLWFMAPLGHFAKEAHLLEGANVGVGEERAEVSLKLHPTRTHQRRTHPSKRALRREFRELNGLGERRIQRLVESKKLTVAPDTCRRWREINCMQRNAASTTAGRGKKSDPVPGLLTAEIIGASARMLTRWRGGAQLRVSGYLRTTQRRSPHCKQNSYSVNSCGTKIFVPSASRQIIGSRNQTCSLWWCPPATFR